MSKYILKELQRASEITYKGGVPKCNYNLNGYNGILPEIQIDWMAQSQYAPTVTNHNKQFPHQTFVFQ